MRNIFFVWLVLISAVLFFGCTSTENPSIPEPPSSPVIEIGDDDYTIMLSWLESPSEVEGYRIRFGNQLIAQLPLSQTSFVDTPAYIGVYALTAYTADAESEIKYAFLPETHQDSVCLSYTTGLNAFLLDTLQAYLLRKNIHVGPTHEYGDSTNEYLADSIDFYVDSALCFRSPRRIVDEGRWSRAFYTKFRKIATGTSRTVLDTLTVLPVYDETDTAFQDSVVIESANDVIQIVAFRENSPLSSSEKIYALIWIKEILPGEGNVWFMRKSQKGKNFRLLRNSP